MPKRAYSLTEPVFCEGKQLRVFISRSMESGRHSDSDHVVSEKRA